MQKKKTMTLISTLNSNKATYQFLLPLNHIDVINCPLPINCIAGSSIPVYTPADNLTLADLVPDLAEEHAPFYTYKGSQTTPPCYETVQWIVMKNQVTVTKDQVARTLIFAVFFNLSF